MFAPDTLAGRRVLITGGGTGLGRAIGERYLSLGASLVICGRRLPVLETTAAEMRAAYPAAAVTAVRCDVRDPAQVEAMLDAIWAEAPLDILVNNATGNFLSQSQRLSVRAVDAVRTAGGRALGADALGLVRRGIHHAVRGRQGRSARDDA